MHTPGSLEQAAPTSDAGRGRVREVVAAYVALAKPRIIELLLVTTVPAMFLAVGGFPSLGLVAATLVGGTLAAGSANVFNSVLDADIDATMRRTRRRPMAREQVAKPNAYGFGVVLGIASVVILGLGANWLSAGLALLANLYYVFVYTMALKRRTAQNIVWGGIAGCFPPLIGWTAVTGSIAWPPLVLFAIVFAWTPPHHWALALDAHRTLGIRRPDGHTETQPLRPLADIRPGSSPPGTSPPGTSPPNGSSPGEQLTCVA